jgi:hypothetical protein
MRAFHFQSVDHGLEAIKNQRLKVTTIDNLNDPFELFAFGLSNKKHRTK